MDHSTKTVVIVVNFNGKEFLGDCLTSLKRQTFSNFRIVVVDNFSHDGSVDEIEELFPDVEVVRLEKNMGFSAANNYAIKQAKGFQWVERVMSGAYKGQRLGLNTNSYEE